MRDPSTQEPLEPDRDQIEIFIDALFRHAGTEGYISLRSFREDDSGKPRITGTALVVGFKYLADAAEDDARRAAQHPAPSVFCPPIAVFSNKDQAREQDCLKGLALSVECDDRAQQALDRLDPLLGPPTLVVASGGRWTDKATGEQHDKLHLHWRLREPASGDDLQALKHARDLATRLVGGDPSNKSVVHPIRWAGSWHRKAAPRMCRIIADNADQEIDLADALAALLAASPREQERASNADTEDHGDDDDHLPTDEHVRNIVTAKVYNASLCALSSRFICQGMREATVLAVLQGFMQGSSGPRDTRYWTRYNKLPQTVRSAQKKFGEAHEQTQNKTEPSFTLGSLKDLQFEPIKSVVRDIIIEGLTLFAGKPKLGKSWLLLHVAIAVARGGFTLGDIHCIEGDVFYCALEDNKRRLKSRADKLLGPQQAWPERLTFRTQMPRLAQGGLAIIADWLKSATAARLVIIDTLAMVRAPKSKSQTDYDADYNAILTLRELAAQYGVAIVVVHHTRKAEADDAFDTVSGTLGLTGAPDSILILKRDTSGTIILHGRGRDLIEIEKAMTFDKRSCLWTLAGEVREVQASAERKAILAAMKDIGTAAPPSEIAAIARLKATNVRRLLLKMARDGLVQRTDYGLYQLLPDTAEE
jgi:hypothetical protein